MGGNKVQKMVWAMPRCDKMVKRATRRYGRYVMRLDALTCYGMEQGHSNWEVTL